MITKILCRLGLHQPIVTHPGVYDTTQGYGRYISAHGFCGRCNKSYQWDF
jgi:hypothetical protein